MGYVHPDKPDIFLSYAHVDDRRDPTVVDPERRGWVTTLVNALETRLARKLGRVDSYDLWRDAKLGGNVELTPEIVCRVRDAAVLLVVLSPAYLASEWCQRELDAFEKEIRRLKDAGGRVFVVEFDRVDPSRRPRELADLRGYPFWVEDLDTRNPQTLGYPIVREKDEEYHKRLNDLCIEVVRELEAIKKSAQSPVAPIATILSNPRTGSDSRPAVYLAEATEDLDSRWEEVRRHLDQAGIRVLPEVRLPRDDLARYRDGVDANLRRSEIFVQLLSAFPGRALPGSTISYVAAQHEQAIAVGKRVLQWHRAGLDAAADEIEDDHRQRLNGATVVATDLSEFKALVVETMKKLLVPQPATQQSRPLDADKLVFINAEETDLEAAKTIIKLLKERDIDVLPPVADNSPEAFRKALTTRMLVCDGMLLVHGDNSDWPVLQWTHFRKVKGEREVPIRAVGLCDLPPPGKRSVTAVIDLHSAHVIDCRRGLDPENFAAFLRAL